MTPVHVVVVATLARLGGAERSLVELVRRLSGELRFTVVVPDEGPLACAVRDAGGTTRIVPWPAAFATVGERARGARRVRALARAAMSLRALRVRLRAAITELAPDVIVTNGLKAHCLGALLRPTLDVPLVWCAREGLEDRPLSRRVLRALGRRCDGVIAISRYVASEFRPLLPGPAPVHVVRNIVDPARVRPNLALPADLTKARGAIWLGVVGALTPLKGQDLFLEAAARIAAGVPSAHFLVLGGEPYRTEAGLGFGTALRDRTHALGLDARVSFLGERDDALAVIANLDVLVQPNRGPEGLGRAILEAMACGVPVVAIDRWGPRELIEDGGTGFLVAPGDVDALAERMRRLAIDPTLRAVLGAAGRRWVRTHCEPGALARAFSDALRAIARLAPRDGANTVDDVAASADGGWGAG